MGMVSQKIFDSNIREVYQLYASILNRAAKTSENFMVFFIHQVHKVRFVYVLLSNPSNFDLHLFQVWPQSVRVRSS